LGNILTDSFGKQVATFLPKNSNVLDVGCGYGNALQLFNSFNFNTTGITIGEDDYNTCKEKGLNVLLMDQSFLHFDDETFDLVWCRHCLEHSIMPYFTLSEFYRVTKPNGFLYLELPLADTAALHETNKNHYSLMNKSMWIELVERTNYKIIDKAETDIAIINSTGKDKFFMLIAKKG
jgi:ubiquinone/menaquinone biosynthesis C-methylase UbiE